MAAVKLLEVQDHPNLYRDPITGVVTNTNVAEYVQRQRVKSAVDQQRAEIDSMKSDISQIKTIMFDVLKAVRGRCEQNESELSTV